MEGNEIPIGWPLGLGDMNSRIRVVATSHVVAPPLPAATSRLNRSSSFSSSSSSNLDTESTASFFPDQSVPLGRLIGIQTANKTGRLQSENKGNVPDERSHHMSVGVPNGHIHNSHKGICAPLLRHVIGRIGPSRTTSRHNSL